MEKIADLLDKIWKWGDDFAHSKVFSIFILCLLWGVIIFLIGGAFHVDEIMCVGVSMMLPMVLFCLLSFAYIALFFMIIGIYNLLSYTERVLFGKNRLFDYNL